ncbi:MAG: glycerol kinase GlpK [Planctomycetes bacterium]|nr:glycerol kinase GlpK [Planctomycetota bacterium]
MSDRPLLLAIDQGTTSSRAILFDDQLQPQATSQVELPQSYPNPGWVEHDPDTILRDCIRCCRQVMQRVDGSLERVAGIGITNQRETIVLWDRNTGRALHPALVWQDRRTTDMCSELRASGIEDEVRARTGLLLDPYFSATKLCWLLDNVEGARAAADAGRLAAGTIDSWLLWNLTGGEVFATEVSNASRTLLFNINAIEWDPWLLEKFRIPASILPQVLDTCDDFGTTTPELFGRAIPIAAMIGDQQAATIGQVCFEAGAMKCTYGTGAFAMQNTGEQCLVQNHELLTTVLWRHHGKLRYALEGSIFSAGSAVQWLRDGLGLIQTAAETEALAQQADPKARVYMVPAFTGLGAPWWNPQARASLQGVTRGTGPAEIVRAALEAACFQTRDLLESARAHGSPLPERLRVDGGMSANLWMLQFLADILGMPVVRPELTETTASGAVSCAALQLGLSANTAELSTKWRADMVVGPIMSVDEREQRYQGWRQAVGRTLS